MPGACRGRGQLCTHLKAGPREDPPGTKELAGAISVPHPHTGPSAGTSERPASTTQLAYTEPHPPALRQMGPFRSPAPSPRAAGPLPQKTGAHLANTTSATPHSAGPHPGSTGGRPCGGWKQTSLTVHVMPWDRTAPPAGQESLCR